MMDAMFKSLCEIKYESSDMVKGEINLLEKPLQVLMQGIHH